MRIGHGRTLLRRYFDPYYYERRAYNAAMEGARDMNFFEAVFSFVFGDGDPNRDFEQRRWALVGLAIQKNNGVVTAEQLAPFLERDEDSRGTDDESFVLPALTRFQQGCVYSHTHFCFLESRLH